MQKHYTLLALLILLGGCDTDGGNTTLIVGNPDAEVVAQDGGPDLDAEQPLDAATAADGELPLDAARDASPSDAEPAGDAGGEDPDSAIEPGCAICDAHAQLIEGLDQVHFRLNMSPARADSARYVPIFWGSAEAHGGTRDTPAGSMPAPAFMGHFGEGRVVVWAGHEGAWTGEQDGVDDNDSLRANILGWLTDDGHRIGFTSGHREWFQRRNLSPAVSEMLLSADATLEPLPGSLTAQSLSTVDTVVLGNPWGELTDPEIDALATWVEQGGGLLVLGLGWSWAGNNNDPSGDRYPINRLGERLGFRALNGAINDPSAPAGDSGTPAYPLQPLDAYRPTQVEVIRASERDVGDVKALAEAQPDTVFVIEGEYMGLQLPTEDWALLDDPAAALDALDQIYLAELALVGGVNPSFNGDMVWIVSVEAPDAPWWMHAGNPIVMQANASTAEVIPTFNSQGHPGWGIAHEQGHNMHGSSCNDLYVSEGTTEVWPNVFGLWSYRQNGWDFRPQMGADLFDAGHAYHAQAEPDFDQLQSNPFIFLGCLDLILTRYGWDGMQRFMTGAATDAAAGLRNDTDAARVAYLVERLSAAYTVDFAPLLTHWGFPVTDASRAITAQYPASDIDW